MKNSKLKLNKKRVAQLNDAQLESLQGGAIKPSSSSRASNTCGCVSVVKSGCCGGSIIKQN